MAETWMDRKFEDKTAHTAFVEWQWQLSGFGQTRFLQWPGKCKAPTRSKAISCSLDGARTTNLCMLLTKHACLTHTRRQHVHRISPEYMIQFGASIVWLCSVFLVYWWHCASHLHNVSMTVGLYREIQIIIRMPLHQGLPRN